MTYPTDDCVFCDGTSDVCPGDRSEIVPDDTPPAE